MKRTVTSLLITSGLVMVMGLTSCVVPLENGYANTSTTVTSYEPGYQTTALPTGYRTEVIGGTTYHYHDGAYYAPRTGGYVVVDAPRTSRYYTEYDQRRLRARREYRDPERLAEQRTTVRTITRLPDGHRVVTHRGTQYYQHQDQYYRREGSGYIVVGSPF